MNPKAAHNPYIKFGFNPGYGIWAESYYAPGAFVHQELEGFLKLFSENNRLAYPNKKGFNFIPIDFYISIPSSICSILSIFIFISISMKWSARAPLVNSLVIFGMIIVLHSPRSDQMAVKGDVLGYFRKQEFLSSGPVQGSSRTIVPSTAVGSVSLVLHDGQGSHKITFSLDRLEGHLPTGLVQLLHAG